MHLATGFVRSSPTLVSTIIHCSCPRYARVASKLQASPYVRSVYIKPIVYTNTGCSPVGLSYTTTARWCLVGLLNHHSKLAPYWSLTPSQQASVLWVSHTTTASWCLVDLLHHHSRPVYCRCLKTTELADVLQVSHTTTARWCLVRLLHHHSRLASCRSFVHYHNGRVSYDVW